MSTRMTGKTYRLCLKAVLKCSEQKHLTIFIECTTQCNLSMIRSYLGNILLPIPHYTLWANNHTVHFGNGSKIILRTQVRLEEEKGFRNYEVITDSVLR